MPATVERVLTPELEKELWEHAGRWVALTRSKLVAVGDSPKDVLAKAKRKGASRPILYYVPKGERTAYYW